MSYRLLSESLTATLPGGAADLQGWEVRDDAGALVGAVRDALLDDAGKVRYLDVQLAGGVGARRVLLPIGFARPWRRRAPSTSPGSRAPTSTPWSGRSPTTPGTRPT